MEIIAMQIMIVALCGFFFALGVFAGRLYERVSIGNTIPKSTIEHPTVTATPEIRIPDQQIPAPVKRSPQSRVMRYPTPKDVKDQRDKKAMFDQLTDLESNKRDSGTFTL